MKSGLMGAMGLRPRQISVMFLLEGAIMGLVGLVAGVGLGLLINFVMQIVGLDYSQFTDAADYMALMTGKIYPTLGIEKTAPARADCAGYLAAGILYSGPGRVH